MIFRFKFVLSLLAIALVLPVFAVAAEKNSEKLQIPTAVEVNGTQLKPGYYKVEWQGNGPSVQVSILKGHKTLAEIPAKMVTPKITYSTPAVVTHQAANGQNVLDQIQFKNTDLVLSSNSGANAARSSGS
ncbi:MAG TPA: hypothetical protein VKW78_12730 [Terriglobales bacterium]|nr:hypothetical protein [Terriglobales bacterium]